MEKPDSTDCCLEELYARVDKEIREEWPAWKQEEYNNLFAGSAHAVKIPIKK